MSKFATFPMLMLAVSALAGCATDGLTPYAQSPNTIIASNHDTGVDNVPLAPGGAGIAYDPDGCQGWIIDDGIEGYSGRRWDPKSGLPICNGLYPPGTVVRNYQSTSPGQRDWVPTY